jgi:predicted SAM-dependent methyltransferase
MSAFNIGGNKLVNLGCGGRFHPAWLNVDIHPCDPSVQKCNLLEKLPFAAGSFEGVYHSHVLEHMTREDGLKFLRECHRVLRASGIIRVAVPDLEAIARVYLEALGKAVDGDRRWAPRYDWIMLEMYDQTVRDSSGGQMFGYVRNGSAEDIAFVRERMGDELTRMILEAGSAKVHSPSVGERLRSLVRKSRKGLSRLMLSRNERRAIEIGAFRLSGEMHKWMYDRYSLKNALVEAGFSTARVVTATESSITNWASYNLDTNSDGGIYKPDSLYMEAMRD